MSSKRKPTNHRFYILGKHNRKHKPKRHHTNKYYAYSKAEEIKAGDKNE